MYKNIEIKYGVQTIFSTLSFQNGGEFEEGMERDFFEKYKGDTGNENSFLYQPLKYYVLGDYDLVYISLINNFKFSNRLFETKSEDDMSFSPHNFQSYSGFSLNKDCQLNNLFSSGDKSYFIGIINLKVNNGLLLGNGLSLIEAIHSVLDKELSDRKIDYLLTQTLSWFELSLCLFINDPKELTTILTFLRTLQYQGLKNVKKGGSLYESFFQGEEGEKIKYASVFSDTHTYFGFNSDLVTEKLKSPYICNFLRHIEESSITLKTQVEWQVKPGHINKLQELLQEHNQLRESFNLDYRQIVLGKSDFLLQKIENENIISTFHLIRYLKRPQGRDVYKHARKVRSYVSLDADIEQKFIQTNDEPLLWSEILNCLAIDSKTFFEIDRSLKALKISRQLRIKILKIFSNYNNGIQDPILFAYFKDFKVFIDNIVRLISSEKSKISNSFFSLKDFEIRLNKHVQAFQEGYNVRFLNSYQFENISDFDLDFNSSIQQLLASYGFLIFEYSKLFYKEDSNAPIIQLNDIDTMSNHLTINYSVHHLTSPEFVFATILKEILNNIRYDSSYYESFLNHYNSEIERISLEINESYFDDMLNSNLIDLNYFIIDSIRFIITFNCDFNLFNHWFWTYNFQNSSLFNSTGMFSETYLQVEMFRVFFVKNYFNVSERLKCPSPELYTYWERHKKKINSISKKLSCQIKKLEVDEGNSVVISFEELIKSIVETYLDNFSEKSNKPDNHKVFMYMGYFDLYAPFVNSSKNERRLKYLFSESVEGKSVFYLERLMFKALSEQYQQNNKRITLLRRDWSDGSALNNHEFLYEKILYAIDQTGGVYFLNPEKTTEYFMQNADSLLSIIDYSLKNRVQFIKEVFNGKN